MYFTPGKSATEPCFSISCSVRLEQGSVTSLLEEKGTIKGVQYKNKNGEEVAAYAPLTIVCDGCFSNLRRSLCNPKVGMTFSLLFLSNIIKMVELIFAYHGLGLTKLSHCLALNP